MRSADTAVQSLGLTSLIALAAACGSEPEPVFSEDYAASYTTVVQCRISSDHDLRYVRIMASADAVAPFLDRDVPFPEGAVLVKEEYGVLDDSCAGPIRDYTVMQRLADGSAPEALDWFWQDVAQDRSVTSEDHMRCINCHTFCGTEEHGGYLGACSML